MIEKTGYVTKEDIFIAENKDVSWKHYYKKEYYILYYTKIMFNFIYTKTKKKSAKYLTFVC